MTLDRARLREELRTDPLGYGYAEWVADGSDQALGDLLNHVRDGVTAPRDGKPIGAAIRVDRLDVTPIELLDAVDPRDLDPSPAVAAWFQALASRPQIPAALVTRLGAHLAPASEARARLAARLTRTGSRAEQLFGAGAWVRHEDVAHALRPETVAGGVG